MYQCADGQTSLRQLLCEALVPPCKYCGKDPREKWYGWWPKGGQPISTCCEERLIQEHGANPTEITKQSLRGLFGGLPQRLLENVIKTIGNQ